MAYVTGVACRWWIFIIIGGSVLLALAAAIAVGFKCVKMKNLKNTQESQDRPLPLTPGIVPTSHGVSSELHTVANEADCYEALRMSNLDEYADRQIYLYSVQSDPYVLDAHEQSENQNAPMRYSLSTSDSYIEVLEN